MLSKEEVFEEYGTVPLKFYNYYKFMFSYVGTAENGACIVYTEGGEADDVYRHQVTPETTRTIEDEGYCALEITLDKETIYTEDSRY